MYQIEATGKWFRRDVVRVVKNLDLLDIIHSRCVALRYPQVYITKVEVGEKPTETVTPPMTISALARDKQLQVGFKMSTQTQKVINIRIGKHLLKMVSHYAKQRGQSQNSFILDAIKFSLDKSIKDYKLSLADYAAITYEKDQYSIRLENSLLKLVDKQAGKIKATRSAWLFWALMMFMESAEARKDV